MTTTRTAPTARAATVSEIHRTLTSFVEPGSLVEIRALKIPGRGKPFNAAGYFSDLQLAAEAAATLDLDRNAQGVYFTVNPPHDSLLARAPNRIVDHLESVTSDREIVCRRLLYVDCDVAKFSNISATEGEHQAARELVAEVESILCDQYGFPRPAIGDSGNGYVAMFRLDLPNDDESTQLLKRFLQALQLLTAGLFTDPSKPRAQVDGTTYNAARVGRLFGTWNRKGFSTPERPHRRSSMGELPEPFIAVAREQLAAIAALAPTPEPPYSSNGYSNGRDPGRLYVDRYLADRGYRFTTKELRDGRTAYILDKCPWDENHAKRGETAVYQSPNGKLGFDCKHDSCNGHDWRQFKAKIGPPDPQHYDRPPSRNGKPPRDESEAPPDEFYCGQPTRPAEVEAKPPAVHPVAIGQLIEKFPALNPPIIHGLLRQSEVLNIIGAPKIGKSWQLYSLLLSVAAGIEWLQQFPCERRRVLLLDNELHANTLTHRIPRVAAAMGLKASDYEVMLELIPLRGENYDLPAIANSIVANIEAGTYGLVALDAWYRALPEGVSENDNAHVMRLYNMIDGACKRHGCAWVNVHHTSKGNQTDKSVTDVGAGAGAQARAADTHLVMRPHEEPGVHVMEGVVRSFAPVEPLPLRWEFPLWMPASDVDPTLLKGRMSAKDERRAKEDKAGIDAIIDALRKGEPLTLRRLMAATSMGKDRVERLAYRLEAEGHIETRPATVGGNHCTLYQLKQEGV